MSLPDRRPLGVLRLIPFPVHGGAELVGALVLMTLPWAAGFQGFGAARNLFVGTGIVLFGLWLFADYKAVEAGKRGVIGASSAAAPGRMNASTTRHKRHARSCAETIPRPVSIHGAGRDRDVFRVQSFVLAVATLADNRAQRCRSKLR